MPRWPACWCRCWRLGLPTSATAAILLAAFEQYNLQPGPQLFTASGTLVWGLIASLYIGNVMLLVLNLPLAGLWVRLLAIPQPLLYGGILVFSTLGVYASATRPSIWCCCSSSASSAS